VRRILLGCMLVAFALMLGVQMASAQEGAPGPPTGRLVPIPSNYDVSKAESLGPPKQVYFILSKEIYEREIYKVSTTPAPQPPPKIKYAVKESKRVTRQVSDYIQGWYEVQQAAPPRPSPTYEWKYVTH